MLDEQLTGVATERIVFPVSNDGWGEGAIFHPRGEAERAVVVHPATGVPARYYRAFAAWLAETQSTLVLTYNYRQSGFRMGDDVSKADIRMSDWAIEDQSAALEALIARVDDLPIWVVGHSLGGLGVPFHANSQRIERVIAVASGPGFVKAHPPSYRPVALMFWYLWGPLLATLLGYIPRWAGLGASLPAPVYWEWRRWCLQPDFYRADWGKTIPVPDLNRFTGTLHHFGIADDPMIPPGQVQKLGMFYPAANSYYRTIHPGDYGLASVGHLALFAPRNKALWSEIMA